MNKDSRELNNETYTQELGIPIVTNFTFKGESKQLIKFEDREFIWINGDDEYYPQIIIPILLQNDSLYPLYKWKESEEMRIILRFLTMLACRFRIPFEVARGHRYQFLRGEGEKHKDYLKRNAVNYSSDTKEIYNKLPESKSMRLAMALFREGINSSSVFYAFLNFYKIIELPFDGKKHTEIRDKAIKWINDRFGEAKEFKASSIKFNRISITKYQIKKSKLNWDDVCNTLINKGLAEKISSDEVRLIAYFEDTKNKMKKVLGDNFSNYAPILQILNDNILHEDVGTYFYKLCRCAIAHASLSSNQKMRNPDDYGDYYEIQKNIETIEALAFYMINSGEIKDR